MTELITDLTVLATPAEPLKFVTKDGIDKEEGESIINEMKEVMAAYPDRISLAAPEIGVQKRVFCIRFENELKFFLNPIIIKKAEFKIAGETCSCMPGKEILITRPEEVTAVYHTAEYKYEENKFLGVAAKLFDQQCQLLDGITPADLGLVSDVETDGSLSDLTEDEIEELIAFYKNYINVKTEAISKDLEADEDLKKAYKELKFTEQIINGRAQIVAPESASQTTRGKATAALIAKNIKANEHTNNRAKLKQFLGRKGK